MSRSLIVTIILVIIIIIGLLFINPIIDNNLNDINEYNKIEIKYDNIGETKVEEYFDKFINSLKENDYYTGFYMLDDETKELAGNVEGYKNKVLNHLENIDFDDEINIRFVDFNEYRNYNKFCYQLEGYNNLEEYSIFVITKFNLVQYAYNSYKINIEFEG